MNLLTDDRLFTRTWYISGALSVLVPLLTFSIARVTYQGDDEARNDEGNWRNFCKWYQYKCRRSFYQYQQANGQQEDHQEDSQAPWWWFNRERDHRGREEGSQPVLVFVYVWSLFLFGSILFFGVNQMETNNKIVISSLLFFANLAFIMMILLQGLEGVVETEGRGVEEHGFVGQVGVLLFLTYLMWLIFSTAFAFILHRRESRQSATAGINDYQMHSDELKPTSRTIT